MPCPPDTAAQVRDHNYAVNKRQNFSSYDIRRKPFRLCNISQYSALREPPGAEKPLGDVFGWRGVVGGKRCSERAGGGRNLSFANHKRGWRLCATNIETVRARDLIK